MEILYILCIGAISGWLAGLLMKTESGSLLWDILLGILGSFVGGWVLEKTGIKFNIGNPTLNLIITSVIGAVVVLFLSSLLRKR